MRWTLAMGGALSLLGAPSWASAQPFPYTAYVQSEHADIHSGPGPEYYATQRVERGAKVQVYRHYPGGWCAIRPPEGSFSWIASDQVRRVEDPTLGEVIAVEAVSYVGKESGDAHEVAHVRLASGELVEILGTKTLAEPSGSPEQTWYQIAAPAGEFRWIHTKHLARRRPRGSAPQVAATPSDSAQPASEVPTTDASRAALSTEPIGSGVWRASAEREEGGTDDESGATDQSPSTGRQPESPPPLGPNARDASSASDSQANAATPHAEQQTRPSNGLDERELAAINVELSRIVTRDPAIWQLDDLKSRVEVVIDTSRVASQRDRARQLLGQIGQFQDIKRRYNDLARAGQPLADAPPDQADPSDERPLGVAESGGSETGSADKVPYDGTGWLMRIITHRDGVPRYALTDRDGEILQFVTPAPGVNLRRFERQEIGVIGRRGYVSQLRRPHVLAERVVVLGRHRR